MSSLSSRSDKLTAGRYLRRRRWAAGLSVDEVAAGYAVGADRDAFAIRLQRIEQDEDAAGPATLDRMAEIFHFDREIYRNLVAGLPAGTALCRECSCSWQDACRGAPANCHWVEPDLCSRCAPISPTQPAQADPSFTVSARDPHAIAILSILAFLRLGEWEQARRALDEAIRDDQLRARVRPILDEKGGQDAAAAALDMSFFRDTIDPLGPVEIFHV